MIRSVHVIRVVRVISKVDTTVVRMIGRGHNVRIVRISSFFALSVECFATQWTCLSNLQPAVYYRVIRVIRVIRVKSIR